jgi:hypothetical protein
MAQNDVRFGSHLSRKHFETESYEFKQANEIYKNKTLQHTVNTIISSTDKAALTVRTLAKAL